MHLSQQGQPAWGQLLPQSPEPPCPRKENSDRGWMRQDCSKPSPGSHDVVFSSSTVSVGGFSLFKELFNIVWHFHIKGVLSPSFLLISSYIAPWAENTISTIQCLHFTEVFLSGLVVFVNVHKQLKGKCIFFFRMYYVLLIYHQSDLPYQLCYI